MPETNVVRLPSVLEAHAKRIHKLMDSWGENTLELGKELKAARDQFPKVGTARPGWKQWIKSEAGLTYDHAANLIRVAEKFGNRKVPKGLCVEIMRYLTVKNVPESAETEIISRIEKGETISKRHARKIIREHQRFPKPTEANKQAKETGQPVQASDGYIYFGTSKADAQAGEDRRTIVYGVKDAIVALAEVELTPLNFIKFMLPHQRWDGNEEKKIEKAREWLNELAKEWSRWEDR